MEKLFLLLVNEEERNGVVSKQTNTGKLLDPITQDSCAFFEDHAVFIGYTGVVYDDSEGERIAKTLGNKKACILQNHGLLTVGECLLLIVSVVILFEGETVDACIWWFMSMERCCQSQILAVN
jgi:Class II Aldolase and Adducin N-terminal domain